MQHIYSSPINPLHLRTPKRAQIVIGRLVLVKLDQHQFVGDDRTRDFEHQFARHVEELHPGEGHRIVDDLFGKAFRFHAPSVTGNSPKNFKRTLRFIVDCCGAHGHGQSSSNQEGQPEPEVHCMDQGWVGAGMKTEISTSVYYEGIGLDNTSNC